VKTAVYGIGNILMGDDGIGPAVVPTSCISCPLEISGSVGQ
jgi:hypothetical protein